MKSSMSICWILVNVTHVLEEVRRYNNQVSFPTMLIGEQVIVGNKSHKIKEALQALCGK